MIRLPPLTFLNGPAGSGKSAICEALCELDPSLCRCSFAEPIRMALLATHYPDQMTIGIDLRDGEVKKSLIPGTGITHRQWMISYGAWMKSLFGPQIFGDLAKRQVELSTKYYDRFIFDDCRFLEELAPFINAYRGQNCLVVHLNRKGTSWQDDVGSMLDKVPGVHHAGINNNGTIQDACISLAKALNQDLSFEPSSEDL